jgi:hypothetical protein
MSYFKAIEYKSFEAIKHLSKMEVNIGMRENLPQCLNTFNGEIFKNFLKGQFLPVKTVVTGYLIILLRSANRSKCLYPSAKV